MKCLGTNNVNDIYLGTDGNLVLDTNLQAVLDIAANAAKTQYGELVLDLEQGVPNFQTVWANTSNVPQYTAYLRRTLEQVPGVVEVKELEVTVDNNVLGYVANINTIYGEGTING